MAATAAQLVNLTVLHQIGLQRFSTTVLRRITAVLDTTAKDIERQIRERLPVDENVARDPTSLRLTTLLEQIRVTQAEAHRSVRQDFQADVDGLADAEATFVNGLSRVAVGTQAALATVSAEQLRAAVMSQPFQGKTLREWTSQFEAGDLRRMREQIIMGYLEGESVGKVAKRVRTVTEISKRGAEALVRTSVTHINARAVAENARANPELFPRYQWVSVLDNRTCCPAGTMVETPSGVRPIEQLRSGDEIIGGSGKVRRVRKTLKGMARRLTKITLDDGSVVFCTPDHMLLRSDQVWVEAGHIRVSDALADRQLVSGDIFENCESLNLLL